MTPTPIIPKADEVRVMAACPFCGDDGIDLTYLEQALYQFTCPGCPSSWRTFAESKAHAIECWNTRAPSPAVGVEVTWEEAEQVAQQFCNTAIGVRSWSKFCHVEQLDIIVEMRAALEAFARGRGKS